MPYAFPLPEEAAALFSQYTPRPMGRHFGFWDKPCMSAGPGSAGCWPGKEARSRSQPQPLPAMPSPALRQPKGAAEVSCFFSFLYSPWRWLKQQLVGQEMKMERDNNYQWKWSSTGCRVELKWRGRVWGWSEFTLPASRESVPVEGPDLFKNLSQSWCRYELHQKESLDKAHNVLLLCQRGKVNSQGLTWCSHG